MARTPHDGSEEPIETRRCFVCDAKVMLGGFWSGPSATIYLCGSRICIEKTLHLALDALSSGAGHVQDHYSYWQTLADLAYYEKYVNDLELGKVPGIDASGS